jgi:hypothetical protein
VREAGDGEVLEAYGARFGIEIERVPEGRKPDKAD